MTQRWLQSLLCLLIPGLGIPGLAAPALGSEQASSEPIHRALDRAVAQYREGLAALRDADSADGRALLSRALEALERVGSTCASAAGCETERLLATYHDLLTWHSKALAGDRESLAHAGAEDRSSGSPTQPSRKSADGSAVDPGNDPLIKDEFGDHSLVRAALHEWLTWRRPALLDAYANYRHMRHLMWPVYEEAGLPEALLFGILAKETGGRVHSVSRAGAAGPLQFMRQTGRRLGLTTVDGFDQRYDPHLATRANAAYLKERLAEFDANLALALAAYNGGETRVRRLVSDAAQPSFWNPEIFRRLPQETREYVPFVLAAALLFRNPGLYGVRFPAAGIYPEPAAAEVTLAAPATLSELAICMGQQGARSGWFRALRNLNPRHDHDVRLPRGEVIQIPAALAGRYAERCIEGPALELARSLHRARGERREILAVRTYVVQRGDTLSTIANEQGCPSSRGIAEANGIPGPNYLIRPGQELKLTGCLAS